MDELYIKLLEQNILCLGEFLDTGTIDWYPDDHWKLRDMAIKHFEVDGSLLIDLRILTSIVLE